MQYSASGNITQKNQYAQTSINGTPATINYTRAYNYNTAQPHAVQQINNDLNFTWDANGNMTFYQDDGKIPLNRYQCWDEENRLIAVNDEKYLSNYVYDAAGERVWKLSGQIQQVLINGEEYVNFADMNENKTLYANPYIVVNDKEYTKHYYIEGQRVASKIGAGLNPSPVLYNSVITPLHGSSYNTISDSLLIMCHRADECAGFNSNNTNYGTKFKCVEPLSSQDNNEPDLYFYHSDHIGSSSFITDNDGYASQHLLFLSFGELYVEQRSTANYYTPYKFSGKEKDEETSYSVISGLDIICRDISIWLSVDPMAENTPNVSPYAYCVQNPVRLIDPDGRDWFENEKTGAVYYNNKMGKDDAGTGAMTGEGWKHMGENGMFTNGNEQIT